MILHMTKSFQRKVVCHEMTWHVTQNEEDGSLIIKEKFNKHNVLYEYNPKLYKRTPLRYRSDYEWLVKEIFKKVNIERFPLKGGAK